MKWPEKLKLARRVLRLSLRDVENKTGISNACVSQMENGQIEDPGYFKMRKLMEIYNLDITDITDEKSNKRIQPTARNGVDQDTQEGGG